ncbi:hypothetical protein JOF43_002461 [Brachybacterium sacelli]|uniref:Uncharacterized protein n=1 Tax=Brachybacterium sacelli TaxID=173364 RepID=A0ABS4X217_9MICO|nr:hypothetical protein [Brachybacterium sacelli]
MAEVRAGPQRGGPWELWLILSFAFIAFTHTVYAWSLAAIGFYGLAAFAITTPQRHRLISHDPDKASVVLSLNQAVPCLAIGARWLAAAVDAPASAVGDTADLLHVDVDHVPSHRAMILRARGSGPRWDQRAADS